VQERRWEPDLDATFTECEHKTAGNGNGSARKYAAQKKKKTTNLRQIL
jgi:hypothetical protein